MVDGRLSALDMSFLCLENTASPMHLGAVAVFHPAEPARPGELVALLAERASRVPRMRRKIGPAALGGASWSEDPVFNARNHIFHHRLEAGGRDDLAALVSDLMTAPLARNRPLWQLHLVSGLAGGRFALLAKMHHALCDGQGAVGIGLGLLDGGDLLAAEPPRAAQSTPSALSTLARQGAELITRPEHVVGDVVGRAGRMFDIASAIVGQLRAPAPTPLLAPPSGTRRAAFVSLETRELQRIRRRHGGTLNDLLLAVVAGALRHWLLGHDRPVDVLRALIPASQRLRSGGSDDANQLSAYLCDLPVGEPDPARRLALVREAMDRNKAAGPNRGAGAIPVLAGLLPSALNRLAAPFAAHAAPLLFDIVVTSVPLPPLPLHLGGARLEELYPIAPLASGHALAIGLSRYRDGVHIGLYADGAALPDMEKLTEALPVALAELDA